MLSTMALGALRADALRRLASTVLRTGAVGALQRFELAGAVYHRRSHQPSLVAAELHGRGRGLIGERQREVLFPADVVRPGRWRPTRQRTTTRYAGFSWSLACPHVNESNDERRARLSPLRCHGVDRDLRVSVTARNRCCNGCIARTPRRAPPPTGRASALPL